MRLAVAMIATAPLTLDAATSLPSPDTASAMIETGAASISPCNSPAADRKYSLPVAPDAMICPLGATATAFNGADRVTILGVPPARGQIRKVRS